MPKSLIQTTLNKCDKKDLIDILENLIQTIRDSDKIDVFELQNFADFDGYSTDDGIITKTLSG